MTSTTGRITIRYSREDLPTLIEVGNLTGDRFYYTEPKVMSWDGLREMNYIDITLHDGNMEDHKRFMKAYQAYCNVVGAYEPDGTYRLVREFSDEEIKDKYRK